ncbi:hypothetical protein Gpo141_00007488 [Globisporangium polare]
MLNPPSRALALAAQTPARPAAANVRDPKRNNKQQSGGATVTAVVVKRKRVRRLTPKQLQERQSSDSRLYNLVLDVNDLKQQVRDLMVQQTLLDTQRFLTTLDGTGSALKTVREFFVVCSGFAPGNRKPLAFIEAVTDPGFSVGGTSFGIEMFFAQWVRYNESFNSHGFTLGATTILVNDRENCIVQTMCMFHGRISRNTIAKLFPAALANEPLVAKLVGRELHFPVKILLSFHNRLMTQLDVDSDIIGGFSELLNNNPFEVAALMSNALIQEGSMIGDLERVEELMDDLALDSTTAATVAPQTFETTEAEVEALLDGEEDEESLPANRHSLNYLLSSTGSECSEWA